ncbi:hypothetical protein MNBD_CHLOROFLEXI01-3275 [hydrothermal vent metagenome]|uniref:DUF2029 domain-containing protein n=1 Tax=hydrothermal vent metagenome TaxID=652676 RepID=A0A3B0VTA2_9ZZZZ
MSKSEKLQTTAWFATAIGYVLGYQYLAVGGYEWILFRQAALNNGLADKVANPPYIFSLLYPLATLSPRVGLLLYTLLAVMSLYFVYRLSGINKWLLLFSFPTVWNLFSAQLDTFSTLGVALGWWAVKEKRPFLIGVALVLLGIKPQATFGLAIVYAIWGWHWKILIAPVFVMLYSFALFGFWPPNWVIHVLNQSSGENAFFNGGLGAFPWGLLAWVPLILGRKFYNQTQFATASIAATLLSSPYVGSYSTMVFLGLPAFWFSYIIAIPWRLLTPDFNILFYCLPIVVLYPLLNKLLRKRFSIVL